MVQETTSTPWELGWSNYHRTRIVAGACSSAELRVYLLVWCNLLLREEQGVVRVYSVCLSVCLSPSPFKLLHLPPCVCMWLNWGPHIRNSLLLCPHFPSSLLLHAPISLPSSHSLESNSDSYTKGFVDIVFFMSCFLPHPLFPSTSIEWFIGIATMEAGGSRNALDHRRNAVKQRRDSTHRDNGRIPASKATGRWRNRKLHSKGRELRSEFTSPTEWAHWIRAERILSGKTALSCRMAIILLLGYSDKFPKTGPYLRNSYWRKTNA